jgi:hypothetical protein
MINLINHKIRMGQRLDPNSRRMLNPYTDQYPANSVVPSFLYSDYRGIPFREPVRGVVSHLYNAVDPIIHNKIREISVPAGYAHPIFPTQDVYRHDSGEYNIDIHNRNNEGITKRIADVMYPGFRKKVLSAYRNQNGEGFGPEWDKMLDKQISPHRYFNDLLNMGKQEIPIVFNGFLKHLGEIYDTENIYKGNRLQNLLAHYIVNNSHLKDHYLAYDFAKALTGQYSQNQSNLRLRTIKP